LAVPLGGKKACLVFNRHVIQPDWTDRFVETGWPNGFFGALEPNSGCWSSISSGNLEEPVPNLTFKVPTNQVAEKLLVVTKSNVPIANTGV
jgi:hypothetical protein